MKALALPSIHLNGTSARDLYDANTKVISALREALYLLQIAAPNARDYYLPGSDSFEVAVEQYKDRYRALVRVMDELHQITNHCADHIN